MSGMNEYKEKAEERDPVLGETYDTYLARQEEYRNQRLDVLEARVSEIKSALDDLRELVISERTDRITGGKGWV